MESKLLAQIPKYLDDVLGQSFLDSLKGSRLDRDTVGEITKYAIGIIGGRNRPWGDSVIVMRARDFRDYIKRGD